MPVKGGDFMNAQVTNKPLVNLRFIGPAIHDGRILLNDLILFVSNFNVALERTVSVLMTGSSLHVGRPQKAWQVASALEIVALRRGSFGVALDLRRDAVRQLPAFDMGLVAVQKLVNGISLVSPDRPIPEGFDQGVLMALRDAGHVFERGIDAVLIRGRRYIRIRKTVYANSTRDLIITRIRQLESQWVAVEGRLLMVDAKEDTLRCRIHPSSGFPIPCAYPEQLVPQMISNVRNFVRVTGEAQRDPITQKIRSLLVRDVEPIDVKEPYEEMVLPTSEFWEAKDFDQLAAEQGIYPIVDLNKIMGGFPEDADFDSFLQAVRSLRDN